MAERGIATGVHYTPIHLYSCYGNKPQLPQAESLFTRIVSLPMFPDISDSEIEQVIDGVSGFYSANGSGTIFPMPKVADEPATIEFKKAA